MVEQHRRRHGRVQVAELVVAAVAARYGVTVIVAVVVVVVVAVAVVLMILVLMVMHGRGE